MKRIFSLKFCFFVFFLWGCMGRIDVQTTTPSNSDEDPLLKEDDIKKEDNKKRNMVTPQAPDDCATPERYFEVSVWKQLFETQCVECHSSGNAASTSELVFGIDSTANYILAEGFARSKDSENENRSLLELKALNIVPHGGGVVFLPKSNSHQLLVDFVGRVDGLVCDPNEVEPLTSPFYDGIRFASLNFVLRRASLALAGRLPTDGENAAVTDRGSLGEAIDRLMEEPQFINRVKEVFNDLLLTDGYEHVYHAILPYNMYSNKNWPTDRDQNLEYDAALRREPVEIVGHVVNQNRPITEILTAEYTMVSPYTARGYGIFDQISAQFTDASDPYEFIEAKLPTVDRQGDPIPGWQSFPHAGVLSTWMWTHRFTSNTNNKNRARTRMLFSQFLGVNLLELSPISSDSAAEKARFENPTTNVLTSCYSCHVVMDPVAGMFQKYNNRGEYSERENGWGDPFYLPAPGFNGEVLPESELWRALPWLAERLTQDDRFASQMTAQAYYTLTQEHVLKKPRDTNDPFFPSKLRAYEAQQEMLVAATSAMVDNNFNFKTAIREIALSNWYMAVGYDPTKDENRDDIRRREEVSALGLSAVLTPEQLHRKLSAILGYTHNDRFIPIDNSASNRRASYIQYGGVDHNQITERPTIANPVMGAVMRQVANEYSCSVLPKILIDDLPTPHPLFTNGVDKTTSDESKIRTNLVHLHALLLGQIVTADSFEIDLAYSIFRDVVADGQAAIANGTVQPQLIYRCRRDLSDSADPDYLIRGWRVVFTYLLRHPRFLLQ